MYFSMYSMFLGHQPRNPVTLRTVQLWEPERIQASCDKTWPGSVPFSKDSQAIVTWRKAWENLGRNQKNRSGELEHDEHDGNSRMGYMSCVFIYIYIRCVCKICIYIYTLENTHVSQSCNVGPCGDDSLYINMCIYI